MCISGWYEKREKIHWQTFFFIFLALCYWAKHVNFWLVSNFLLIAFALIYAHIYTHTHKWNILAGIPFTFRIFAGHSATKCVCMWMKNCFDSGESWMNPIQYQSLCVYIFSSYAWLLLAKCISYRMSNYIFIVASSNLMHECVSYTGNNCLWNLTLQPIQPGIWMLRFALSMYSHVFRSFMSFWSMLKSELIEFYISGNRSH